MKILCIQRCPFQSPYIVFRMNKNNNWIQEGYISLGGGEVGVRKLLWQGRWVGTI